VKRRRLVLEGPKILLANAAGCEMVPGIGQQRLTACVDELGDRGLEGMQRQTSQGIAHVLVEHEVLAHGSATARGIWEQALLHDATDATDAVDEGLR
jgi:hypothetical protein